MDYLHGSKSFNGFYHLLNSMEAIPEIWNPEIQMNDI